MSRGGNGGPQADCFGETAIAINDQQLKEKNYISTDGGPQADCFDERELSQINRELKENNFAPWMICEPNEKEGKKLLEEIKELKIKD